MHVSPRFLSLAGGLAVGSVPLALALTLPALPGVRAADSPAASQTVSPQQVAETLDSIIQPRFQKNAGLFGISRVKILDGHDRIIEDSVSNSRLEAQRFAAVNASHRSYIIAFLHCRHKPGAHMNPPTPAQPLGSDFKPFTEALITTGATQTGTQKMYDWAEKALNPVVLPYLPQLKQGQSAQVDYENWVVVMRPVRALHQACLNCHAGTKRGDTLGVMVYAVDKNAKIKRESFEAPGGE